jgi:hypothetical protein
MVWNQNSRPASITISEGNKKKGVRAMKKKGRKLLMNASPAILLILISILSFPCFSFAAGTKLAMVGKPQRIQDPQRLERAMEGLLNKAYSQHRIINNWYRKAKLAAAKMQAEKSKERSRTLATEASRRACQIQLAMTRTPEDITIPGCRPNAESR